MQVEANETVIQRNFSFRQQRLGKRMNKAGALTNIFPQRGPRKQNKIRRGEREEIKTIIE